MKFQRTISPLGLLLAGIGSILGSGWLFGPLYAAQIAGPASILAWIIGGLLMVIIALTFAELGSAFPVAGGMVQFAHASHGRTLSFLIGWMVWISSVAVAPVETLGILQYLATYIPGLMVKQEGAHLLTLTGIGAASIIMFIMCILNFYGAKFFSRSNSFITAIKLIVPMLTILILLCLNFHATNFYNPNTGGFIPLGWHGVVAALPLGGVIYSFIGSNTVLQLAAETKNPQRSIPLALIGSMLFCILLYSLLQIAFIGALDSSTLTHGWQNLNYVGDTGPFSGLMAALGFSWFVIIIYADAIISPFGTGYVFTASTARIGYSLSHLGFMPAWLGKLASRGVPVRYILLNFIIGLLLFLPFPAWQKLVSFIVSCFILSYIIGPIALVGLRKLKPGTPRPFFLPYGNLVALLAFYICNLLIFWTGWQTVSKMLIALSFGFCIFIITQARSPQFLNDILKAWWVLPYFILLLLISYLGSFGGGLNVLRFGMDFGAVGLLTLIIFYFVKR